jgi:hypothetical protein
MRDHGIEVAATAGNAAELHEAVTRHVPDVALVDIRMPPPFTDEGLAADERIRAGFPDVGELVLPQHLDARYALRVAEGNPAPDGLPVEGSCDRLAHPVRGTGADRGWGVCHRPGSHRGSRHARFSVGADRGADRARARGARARCRGPVPRPGARRSPGCAPSKPRTAGSRRSSPTCRRRSRAASDSRMPAGRRASRSGRGRASSARAFRSRCRRARNRAGRRP